MRKSLQLWLARKRIARWKRKRGVLAFLGTWLPAWCLIASLVLPPIPPIILAAIFSLPVMVIARYFIARQRAQVVLQKIYDAMRLNHPLYDNLLLAGGGEPGILGVRLQTLAEELHRGMPLAGALRLAVPEVAAADLASIEEAEKSGFLLNELHRICDRRRSWPSTSELDVDFLAYFICLLITFALALMVFRSMIAPHLYRGMGPGSFPFSRPIMEATSFLSYRLVKHIAIGFLVGLPFAILIIAAILLRRLAIPFFRRGTVSIYIRDAVAWHLPIMGSLIRCRSWSDGARILAQGIAAGQPLPEVSQSAVEAAGSRVAKRRLRRWREMVLTGTSADRAARQCGLPRLLCGALAQPLGSTGSALGLVAGYYDLKYRSKVDLLRACSIPIAVLCMGILVLLLCLALYVPYVHILRMISGGAGS